MSVWPPARLTNLRRLRSLGYSFVECGEILGTTKGAVAGAVWHYLRQDGRVVLPPVPYRDRRSPATVTGMLARDAAPIAAADELPTPSPNEPHYVAALAAAGGFARLVFSYERRAA